HASARYPVSRTKTPAWPGPPFLPAATVSHSTSCHNGRTATGLTTPPHIPTATLQCSNCHANTAASFTTYTMNHAAVSGTPCASCHNGAYTSQGTAGALGLTTPPHIPTGTLECSTCHTNRATGTTNTMTQAAGGGTCTSCHGGAFVSQGTSGAQTKSAAHAPPTAECPTCHKSTTTWAGAAFA